jgi:hypothetical protein
MEAAILASSVTSGNTCPAELYVLDALSFALTMFYFPAEHEIIVAFLATETAERALQKKG